METVVTRPHERKGAGMMAGGSGIILIGGLAAIVLSIIGLAREVPQYMLSVAIIVLGVALLFEGGFVVAEFTRLASRSPSTASADATNVELTGGLSSEALAGVAAITLGVLSLLNIVPHVLTSVASIVLGAGFMVGSGAMARFNSIRIEPEVGRDVATQVAHDAMSSATGVQVLAGLSAIVLGILALINIAPEILNLVAMLTLGASFLLSGSAIAGKTLSIFAH